MWVAKKPCIAYTEAMSNPLYPFNDDSGLDKDIHEAEWLDDIKRQEDGEVENENE